MKDRSQSPRYTGRLVRALVLTAVLSLTATACSSDSGSESSTSSTTPDAKKALAALNSGLMAHTAGKLDEATEHYETALEYDPKNKFALYNLAIIDEASGNYGLAEEKYRASLKTDPAYEPALFNLAILRTESDPQEAISLYQDAVAANKKDAAAWLNLGLLLRATGEIPAGDKAVLRAIALDPSLKDPDQAASRNSVLSP